MRYPYDADADSNGDVLCITIYRDGVKKFLYGSKTLDTGFGNKGFLEKVIEHMKVIQIAEHLIHIVAKLIMINYYTTAFYERSIVAIRASDGRCLKKYYLGIYPYNMTIDKSTGYLYVGGSWI